MNGAVGDFLVKWLQITDVEKLCIKLCSNKQEIFEFSVDVDMLEILAEHEQFGPLLLNSPGFIEQEFKKLFYHHLTVKNWIPALNNASQLVVSFQIHDLPPLPGYKISHPLDVKRCNEKKLYRIDGVVTSKTLNATFIKSSRFVCANNNCPGSSTSNSVIIHNWEYFNKNSPSTDWCGFCGEILIEDPAGRTLAEMCLIEMVPCNAFSWSTFYRFQPLTVHLKGEHSQNVEIGGSYTVSVFSIPSTTYKTARTALEASTVVELKEISAVAFDKMLHFKTVEIYNTFRDKNTETHALLYILAFTFASCQTIKGSYFKLKLGILLSLVHCKAKENSNGIGLLAVGQDTSVLNRLLQFGANLASRATRVVSHKQLKSTISKHQRTNSLFVITGNPLLLSRGGICYFGDLAKFSRAHQATIAQILESGKIPVDCSRVPAEMRLKDTGIGNDSCYEGTSWAYIDDWIKCTRFLLDEFSVTYHCDDPNWESPEIEFPNNSYFTSEEIKKIINHAKTLDVRMGPKVENFIQLYFVASRRVRSSSSAGVEFPISSLLTIAGLTAAISKLSMRSECLEMDATLAIFIYEEYVTAKYGPSQLNVQPKPHIPASSTMDIVQKMADELGNFEKKLHQFLKSYAGDTLLHQPEE